MSLKILEIGRFYEGPDSDIVSLVSDVVGEQITVIQFGQICERLSGEDYTIAERFWPSLGYLYDIVKQQENENDRVEMAIQLATTARYAVWEMFSTQEVEPSVWDATKDCCRLFLESCFLVSDVDDKRYLLMGIAASMGDSEAAEKLHDLGSGNA